jgi:signal transduction histidine kinase
MQRQPDRCILSKREQPLTKAKKKILVVEDDAGARFTYQLILQHEGYEVISANTLQQGRTVLENEAPDLAIVDYALQEDSCGLELLSVAKNRNLRTRFILMTGFSGLAIDEVSTLEEGPDEILFKPIGIEEFCSSVSSLLARTPEENELKRLRKLLEVVKADNRHPELPARGRARMPQYLQRIVHDLRGSTAAIRNGAAFLHRTVEQLDPARTRSTCYDILADAEVLLFHTTALEHTARMAPPIKLEKVDPIKDVIAATIVQLEPLLQRRQYSLSGISWPNGNSVIIYVDRDRLRYVTYALLITAIDRAAPDAEQFRLSITSIEGKDFYIIKFQDWGVGFTAEMAKNIFGQYRRTAKAINSVMQHGSTLALARRIMRGHGGDLKLGSRANPTEFQLILPK